MEADLQAELQALPAEQFCSDYILDATPVLFAGNRIAYLRWRTDLATRLEVDPHNMVMTGSAAVGFSLNPHKNLRPFGEHSDIDLAVISQYHFDLAWRWLRGLVQDQATFSGMTR